MVRRNVGLLQAEANVMAVRVAVLPNRAKTGHYRAIRAGSTFEDFVEGAVLLHDDDHADAIGKRSAVCVDGA